MKLMTIVGARPQFIKAAAVSRAILNAPHLGIEEILVHTGQHYDNNMSQVFFDELNIPKPQHHLNISGGTHGVMTGRMLAALEEKMLQVKPDMVLVYGDTNSTLAAALAAAKLHIPLAHVEAGLRSFNMKMPEEVNRILTDRVSKYLFCPTETAVQNLKAEGMEQGVHEVGDVMFDVMLYHKDIAKNTSRILDDLQVRDQPFVLATCHRAENTDHPERLRAILQGLAGVAKERQVILPLHPRTREFIKQYHMESEIAGIKILEPLSFHDLIALEQAASVIVTDSGGIQKEAFFCGVPCVTLRDETEWVETVETGWNQLAALRPEAIYQAVMKASPGKLNVSPYGNGQASMKTLECLVRG